ncbi:MAG: DegT/DnrJ/EryC1/StrS family aminotransferase [Halobacteriovoraceae bacterium]|nr:DegT/DnrJ/EryC1/StrS family aminotransferase [Halobacteriovoraceae bacterium]
MRVKFVDLRKQYDEIREEVNAVIQDVLNETAFINGKYVNNFCSNFSQYIGVKHAVGVGNGTDAITLALKALKLNDGDEVITVANSFFATAEAITNAKLKVKFVDCLSDTYNIDYDQIEAQITPKTKVLMPVHLYGQPAQMDKIMEIAKKHSLYVIEDCAQAHGAKFQDKMVGSFADLACFSFYPGKNLGAYGDGGMVVTNSEKLAENVRVYADHGSPKKYQHDVIGVNSRLDGMQAAILDVKLKYLDGWTKRRREGAELYSKNLGEFLTTPQIHPDAYSVYHLYIIQIENREGFMKYLNDQEIDCGLHYPCPIPATAAYRDLGHSSESFKVSNSLKDKIVSLPIHGSMGLDEAERVIEAVKKYSK